MEQGIRILKAEVPKPIAGPQHSINQSSWLLGPLTDPFLVGGASLLMFVASWLFIDPGSSTIQISWTAYYLAFVINNPHFMASYLLLYSDRREALFRSPRYLWAAIGAPLLLAGYMAWAIFHKSSELLAYAVNAMYFLVGWHYVKQIYGTMVVSSAKQGYYFTKNESWLLKGSLVPVWFLSYFSGNKGIREVMHYGLAYKTFEFPLWLSQINRGFLLISLFVVGFIIFSKWIKSGKWPSVTALISLAAIYCWYLPEVYHPHFWFLIPFFHSLQYMLFVTSLKKNQFWIESKEVVQAAEPHHSVNAATERVRSLFVVKILAFVFLIIALGAITFKYLPEALDQYVIYDHSIFGSQLFVFLFITFINIHHYFIDNVIWRRDNPMVRAYL